MTFDEVAVLRSLAVVDTGSARRDMILSLRNRSHTQLELLIEKTRSALARAADFLVSDCFAVSSDFLPYERQLMLLTYVMSDRSSLSANEVQMLRKWFWRTSFSERYRVGGEALFDEDLEVSLKLLRASAESELRRYGQAPSRDFFISSQFRKPAAASKAFAAFLGSHKPRNLTNGAYIDVGEALSEYNRKEFHHLFPQKVLKDWKTSKELINSLANICMLTSSENKKIRDKQPSVYIKELKQELGSDFESVMETNLIPPDAINLLLEDKYTDFLNARGDYLAQRVSALI